jgi:hypothetical protein
MIAESNKDKVGLTQISTDNAVPVMSEHTRDLSIWIDAYSDIFSDFDPRLLSERNISDDFLYEIKRVCSENDFSISLFKLLVPAALRDEAKEAVITRRLHEFFRKKDLLIKSQLKGVKRSGLLIAFSGILLLIGAGYISYLKLSNFFMHVLIIVTEPAGWYLIWTGIESVRDSSKSKKSDFAFFSKMAKSKIVFLSI